MAVQPLVLAVGPAVLASLAKPPQPAEVLPGVGPLRIVQSLRTRIREPFVVSNLGRVVVVLDQPAKHLGVVRQRRPFATASRQRCPLMSSSRTWEMVSLHHQFGRTRSTPGNPVLTCGATVPRGP